jgi:hypothetical protein
MMPEWEVTQLMWKPWLRDCLFFIAVYAWVIALAYKGVWW